MLSRHEVSDHLVSSLLDRVAREVWEVGQSLADVAAGILHLCSIIKDQPPPPNRLK